MLAAVLALAAGAGAGGCAGSGRNASTAPAEVSPLVLLMPPVNHTGDPGATAVLAPRLAAALAAGGFRLLPERELRPALRRHRIRSGAKFDAADAAALAAETGAELVIFSALDFFRPGPAPEVGFSARLVRLADQRILGAASVAASGEDAAGAFGRGRIESAEALADLLGPELAGELTASARRLAAAAARGGQGTEAAVAGEPCRRLALVPLDDLSGSEGAGEVTTNILLSRLLRAGYLVLEPGLVRARCLESGAAPRGRIDLQTLRELRESLGPCLVITGSVEAFTPAQGDPREAAPALSLALRVLDAAGGRLLLAWDTETDGADGQTFLQFGREHALGGLTWRALDGFLDRLDELERETDRS